MLSDFASSFDSFYSDRCDQHSYLESKGYQQQGERTIWQPQDPNDLEPETSNYDPGAMQVGELDEFYADNDEPDLRSHLCLKSQTAMPDSACGGGLAHQAGLEGVR